MEINEAINILESSIKDPDRGLPEDVFLFVSRLTPLVNVDLLIKNNKNQTLMTWREDSYYPPGWHIPGGIVRYKETISDRTKAVARNELGVTKIKFNPVPLAINEVIHPERKERGHFISLLFKCSLLTPPDETRRYRPEMGKPKANEWMWHNECPKDILEIHQMYRQFI